MKVEGQQFQYLNSAAAALADMHADTHRTTSPQLWTFQNTLVSFLMELSSFTAFSCASIHAILPPCSPDHAPVHEENCYLAYILVIRAIETIGCSKPWRPLARWTAWGRSLTKPLYS